MGTNAIDVHGAVLSRRQFVKSGGALIVGAGVLGPTLLTDRAAAQGRAVRNGVDPTLAGSWFEIHADNTLTVRTGKSDFGQSSATTAYKQLVAEELYFPIESITTMIMGDTDQTPDGGFSAAFLGMGGNNLRKAAAYTREALVALAATRLGVDKSQLTLKDGTVSGGGKSVTYGQLVAGQQLTLSIPVAGSVTGMFGLAVTGNPPLKPVSQYTVIGMPYKNYATASKVAAKETWATDVRLPGMLHGRVIHPKTVGSTLVAAGKADKARFPNAEVVVIGNLVGVVAPTEWEAIGASQQVATDTKWTDWKGLPGHANLYTWMREQADWKTTPVAKGPTNHGDHAAALTGATRTMSATYELPFMKHAPIGPTMAVGDVKADGTIFVHTHNQNPQFLRSQLARMLGTAVENIVVRNYSGPGHYGRSNGGNAGAEDEAVLLSKAVGRPVRVQWMRPDDMQWSTSSPAAFSNIRLALDAQGSIVGAQLDHYMPAMQDDRLVGALLAGLPTTQAPDVTGASPFEKTINVLYDPWVYDRVPHLGEFGYGTYQIGQKASPIAAGLRDHSLRTPGQMQQNFPRELAISEAAVLARMDPLEYRIQHTKDERMIGVLNAVRKASGWQARPSPGPKSAASGAATVTGQGVSVMLRSDAYWACVCQVSVNLATGKTAVTKYTVAVDPGIVVNPLQLKRQVQGGAIMGISHALHEEMRFDESGVTSRDWLTYPIATMADVPEVEVVILAKPETGVFGGGSEAANALALPAIAAAFFDATGKVARRLPLTPAYVQALLKA